MTITGLPFFTDWAVFEPSWPNAEMLYQLVWASTHSAVSRSKRRSVVARRKPVTAAPDAVWRVAGSVATKPRTVMRSCMVCLLGWAPVGAGAGRRRIG